MPGPQNTSFIPKHTTNKTERRNAPRQFFLGTVLVRVLFFSVLIASAVSFFYERKLSSELANEISAFRVATESFNSDEGKVQMVLAMNKRLKLASDNLNNSISVASLLKAIEVSSIATVEINKLEIMRKSNDEIVLEAGIVTDTFDSVMFQRKILEENEVLKSALVKDVTITNPTELQVEGTKSKKVIVFNASISIDPKTIPITIIKDNTNDVLVPALDTTPDVQILLENENISSNQENI